MIVTLEVKNHFLHLKYSPQPMLAQNMVGYRLRSQINNPLSLKMMIEYGKYVGSLFKILFLQHLRDTGYKLCIGEGYID